jgi:hypothetical protein
VQKVWIEKRSLISPLVKKQSNISTDSDASDLPWTFIEFSTLDSAYEVVRSLHGMVVGGEEIVASLYASDLYKSCVLSDSGEVRIEKEEEEEESSRVLFCVKLLDFVELDQMSSEEEREEVVKDILSIVREYVSELDFIDELLLFPSSSSDGFLDVLVPIGSVSACVCLSQSLASRVVGGECVQVQVVKCLFKGDGDHMDAFKVVYKGSNPSEETLHIRDISSPAVVAVRKFLSEDDLQGSTEDLAAVKVDLIDLCGTHSSAVRRVRTSAELDFERGHFLSERDIENIMIQKFGNYVQFHQRE